MRAGDRYDRIGHGYARFRGTEPTWLAEIDDALGAAERVLNVGAGTGSYEPSGRRVVALEPSQTMIDQRAPDSAPVVRAVAEAPPFADDSFDATMGVLTVHHWADRDGAFARLRRLAPRHVYVLYDIAKVATFWLVDYFPQFLTSRTDVDAPTPETIGAHLRVTDVRTLWVPHDCRDGFTAASWARPHDYLDPERRESISTFALADPEAVRRGVERLRGDLESGLWDERYGSLVDAGRIDAGYRLVVAERD